MTDYMVVSVAEDKDDDIVPILMELEFRMSEYKGDVVFVGSLEKVRRISDENDIVLPFSSFVDNLEDLIEAVENRENMIFFDSMEGSSFLVSMHIMENSPCLTFLYIGNHERYYDQLLHASEPNVLFRLILSSDGRRIFPYPRTLERTREAIMDRLVNIDSLTANSFFRRDLPFVLVKEDVDDGIYDEVLKSAEDIGMEVRIIKEEELGGLEKGRAVLAFSSLGHSDDLSIYFGLPFWYFNAVRLPKESIKASLSITKIIERGYL